MEHDQNREFDEAIEAMGAAVQQRNWPVARTLLSRFDHWFSVGVWGYGGWHVEKADMIRDNLRALETGRLSRNDIAEAAREIRNVLTMFQPPLAWSNGPQSGEEAMRSARQIGDRNVRARRPG